VPQPCRVRHGGFTLIEILVVVAIIAILAALAFPSFKGAMRAADRIDALARMRQVGGAIQAYAADNDARLPGPLWSGQTPRYGVNSTNALGFLLWQYLGTQEPAAGIIRISKPLAPKAYVRFSPGGEATAFYMNVDVQIHGASINPWGVRNDASKPPSKVFSLSDPGLTATWAMQDVDKTGVPSKVGTWYATLPKEPLYNPYRLKLYFDWHVAVEPLK
jgi:prepilin-type N-terminal cleavage/methylation domain-containing protein